MIAGSLFNVDHNAVYPVQLIFLFGKLGPVLIYSKLQILNPRFSA